MNISELTRKSIIDYLLSREYPFHGGLDLLDFLRRIWILYSMPSTDNCFKTAEGEIWQHMVRNIDWEYKYLLYTYLNILKCDDEKFLKFLETCLHPLVLYDEKKIHETLSEFNNALLVDRYKLKKITERSGKPTFKAIKCPKIETFNDKTPSNKSSYDLEIDHTPDMKHECETPNSILQREIKTYDFDVFLCYRHEDMHVVKKIGEILKERGILPWLYDWEIRAGQSWQKVLEQQIKQIKSAAVFIGKHGISPWQERELNALLNESIERNCLVIPIFLSDVPIETELPIFLKEMTCVDFRKNEPNPIEQLIRGINEKYRPD